ncbi:MAG: hypothetical protein ACLFVE_09110 [Chitinispirillaceae bacterium]
MYKALLMFFIALCPLAINGVASQSEKGKTLPDEIASYYSNHNYLSSLEAGKIEPDSAKPSKAEIRKQLSEATNAEESRSVLNPDQNKGPWAHRTLGKNHYKLEIEEYKVDENKITLQVRSRPINKGKGALVTRQVHKWTNQDGRWVKDIAMIQQL